MSARIVPRRDGSVIVFFDDGRVARCSHAGGDVFADVRIDRRMHRVGRVPREATSPVVVGATAPADGVLRARTAGTVQSVVLVGDVVAVDALVCTIELMKMTLEVRAPWAGVVEAVHVARGAAVTRGAPLVTIR